MNRPAPAQPIRATRCRLRALGWWLGALVWLCGGVVARAATLPRHDPLAIVIVADEVNPHGLTDAQLTQPKDFEGALTAADSGLSIRTVQTVDSQCVDVALDALAGSERPDVVLYFAHRAAKRCDGSDAQGELTAALEQGLQDGLGLVALHHGLYSDLYTPGAKDGILQLIGAQCDSIAWNTEIGQRVFNVGGGHFIATNGMSYTATAAFRGTGAVAAGEYPYFDNVPDERYPQTRLLEQPLEVRTPLFATDSGGERLLGYTLSRPGWIGVVVAYQPAEYQPNALDDRQGSNFQILANALYFASRKGSGVEPQGEPASGDSSDAASSTEATGVTEPASQESGAGQADAGLGIDSTAIATASTSPPTVVSSTSGSNASDTSSDVVPTASGSSASVPAAGGTSEDSSLSVEGSASTRVSADTPSTAAPSDAPSPDGLSPPAATVAATLMPGANATAEPSEAGVDSSGGCAVGGRRQRGASCSAALAWCFALGMLATRRRRVSMPRKA